MDLEDAGLCAWPAISLLGSKGTTGTQASFLELFDGDQEKCKQAGCEDLLKRWGLKPPYPVSGQTYSSASLTAVCSTCWPALLSPPASSANDIRLLQHMQEVEEPFEKSQVGSSAMAYKRNPMRSERICLDWPAM